MRPVGGDNWPVVYVGIGRHVSPFGYWPLSLFRSWFATTSGWAPTLTAVQRVGDLTRIVARKADLDDAVAKARKQAPVRPRRR